MVANDAPAIETTTIELALRPGRAGDRPAPTAGLLELPARQMRSQLSADLTLRGSVAGTLHPELAWAAWAISQPTPIVMLSAAKHLPG